MAPLISLVATTQTKTKPNSLKGGCVRLNDKILERSGKKSFEPDVVLPYLKDNINWGILKVRYQLQERFGIFLIAVLDISGMAR